MSTQRPLTPQDFLAERDQRGVEEGALDLNPEGGMSGLQLGQGKGREFWADSGSEGEERNQGVI